MLNCVWLVFLLLSYIFHTICKRDIPVNREKSKYNIKFLSNNMEQDSFFLNTTFILDVRNTSHNFLMIN